MASRLIIDCVPELQEAWDITSGYWSANHSEKPQPFITCTYRSPQEQDALYAIGRTVKGRKVTNAQAYESPHNFYRSFAFDIGFITLTKKLDWSAELFKAFAYIMSHNQNVMWGGNFKSIKDNPHFELKNWKERVKSKNR